MIESNGFEIVRTEPSDFDAGRSIFRQHQGLSLTGGIIAGAMAHRNLEHLYSFDGGFDAVDDIVRLDTDVEPRESTTPRTVARGLSVDSASNPSG